ncbi:hypothetical protein BDR26DRAFT_931570 [Obelidium mucronatum]|nr:hypothetical protein BDR26DRAFT_931570 [Obelidium mucronatum]
MVSQAVNKEYAVWAAGQTKTINFKELTNWFATNYKDQDIFYSLADLEKMARKQRSRGIFVSDAEYLGEYNSVLTAMDDNVKPGDAVANNDWRNFCKVVTTLDKLERSTKAVSKGSRRKKGSDSSSDESSSDTETESSSESSDSESSSSSSSESEKVSNFQRQKEAVRPQRLQRHNSWFGMATGMNFLETGNGFQQLWHLTEGISGLNEAKAFKCQTWEAAMKWTIQDVLHRYGYAALFCFDAQCLKECEGDL